MYEAVCYDKPFLTQVIVRIDFLAASDMLQKSVPSKLAGVISERFPIVEPTVALAQELRVEVGKGVKQSQSSFKQWNFYGKEREKQLALAPSFVFAAFTRYTTYESLKSDFLSVMAGIEASLPDLRAGRFGLRYINSVDIENVNPITIWNDLISPDLLGITAFSTRAEHLTRLLHLVELKYDELNVRFQFGMPNPDYPAVIKRAQFVLDLDAYVQTAHELKESSRYMDDAHQHIQDLFEKSITSNLRERMRVRPTAAVQ